MAQTPRCANCGGRIDLPDSDVCAECARLWQEYVTYEKST